MTDSTPDSVGGNESVGVSDNGSYWADANTSYPLYGVSLNHTSPAPMNHEAFLQHVLLTRLRARAGISSSDAGTVLNYAEKAWQRIRELCKEDKA